MSDETKKNIYRLKYFLRKSGTFLKHLISSLTTWFIAASLIVAIFSLIILYVDHGIRMAEKTLPVLNYLLYLALILNGLLVPMALIGSHRIWVRKGLLISSVIFALLAWIKGILLSWIIWDGIAVIIGLIVMGVGVIPIALFATAFNEMWTECGLLILSIFLTFILRKLALTILPGNK